MRGGRASIQYGKAVARAPPRATPGETRAPPTRRRTDAIPFTPSDSNPDQLSMNGCRIIVLEENRRTQSMCLYFKKLHGQVYSS